MPPSRDAASADALQLGLHGADAWARALHGDGHRVLRTLGTGLPLPLLAAAGLTAVALQPAAAGTQRAEEALVDSLVEAPPWPLLVRTDDPRGHAVFSIARERLRIGELPPRPMFGLDLPGGAGRAAARYRQQQLQQLLRWLRSLGDARVDDAAVDAALALEQARTAMLQRLDRQRSSARPSVGARDGLAALVATDILPPALHQRALEALCAQAERAGPRPGPRVFVAGLYADALEAMQAIDGLGLVVVGDDLMRPADEPLPAERFARLLAGPLQDKPVDPRERAARTVQQAQRCAAVRVVHLQRPGDERERWFRPWLQRACEGAGLVFQAHDTPAAAAPAEAEPPSAPAARQAVPADGRSRKSLDVVAEFSRHQREWFASIRQRAAAGEAFAVVNADAPQELLRAFDVPFVVNQWWGSIVAAKQQSARYLQLLGERGYPVDAEPYSAQGLAALFDDDAQQAPWGGLPRPQLLLAVNGTPATAGIFSSWAAESGAELLLFDRSAETRVDLPLDWWEQLPAHWDTWLQPERLDLLQAQFEHAIERIQAMTGRRFDEARFREVMDLVNHQETYFRDTRDLIARAPAAPVSVVDTMPAIMVPQWHRGTHWGVEAARSLHEEVRQRVERGQTVCAEERIRLMWVGRGLWSQMGFYQQWEHSHGAVFVWSMYQGLAADGYLRYVSPRQSALRALASRFVTMGDELRMPTWAGAWHVKEARLHRVDAAVAVDDADPLVLQALEREGIPVLRLNLGNFGVAHHTLSQAAARVGPFLEHVLTGRGTR